MHHVTAEPLAWIAGFSTSLSTLLASVTSETIGGGWLPLIVQSGMAGIVVLILLKHFPELIRAQAEANALHAENMRQERDAFERSITRIVESNERKDEAWQKLIAKRGYCPSRDVDFDTSIL